MKDTRFLMGMHVTVELADTHAKQSDINAVYEYLHTVDERFSTYKTHSEITKINRGQLSPSHYSHDMATVLRMCDQTKRETAGYFNCERDGYLDPSGIVKGWAIQHAAQLLYKRGLRHYFVDCGGDIQTAGTNNVGSPWRVGIRNPFHQEQIVKVLMLSDHAIATSGTSMRGQHIYNPHNPKADITEIVSLSVLAPDILEADRFATAAFAMGKNGISFIEERPGLEGYVIDREGVATYTSGFDAYVAQPRSLSVRQLGILS